MWLLVVTAMAQEEICELRTSLALEDRIDTVTDAFARAELGRARSELELARDDARCLDSVISGPLLARLAYVHAEHSVYEQDLETVWRWVRLAEIADPGGPLPPHLGEEHPLVRFLLNRPESPSVEDVDRGVAHPKKGGVFMDGRRLLHAEAMAETPHLIQVFSNKVLVSAFWQVGPRFDPSVLTVDEPDLADEVMGPKRWKPARKNTVAAWEKWVRQNPDSEWMDEARLRLDDVRFDEARAGGQPALRAYLADSPGRNARAARAALEKVEFDATGRKNTRQAWQVYLGRHPKGVYVPEALERLDTLVWTEATEQDDDAAYAKYLTQMRQGVHREEARVLLAKRVFEMALASGEVHALRRYLSRFPAGADADRARAEIRGTHFDAVAIVVLGDAPAELLDGLIETVEESGMRAESLDAPESFHEATRATLGNGLLWVEVKAIDDLFLRAEVSLWADRSPISQITVDSAPAELLETVRKRLPDMSAFSGSGSD